MTNAEYIRSLDDKGLAHLLSMFCMVSSCSTESSRCPFEADCPGNSESNAWLNWLQQTMIV